MKEQFANFGGKWHFSKSDFNIGLKTHEYERTLMKVDDPLTPNGIFPAFVYSILSAAQNTSQLVNIFDRLRRYGLMNPSEISKENAGKIKVVLSKTHFPNQKYGRFMKLGEWFLANGDLLNAICQNSKNLGGETIALRNKLALSGCAGVGYKVASFILQLSIKEPSKIDVVVIDKWILTFLNDIGYPVTPPDYKTVSGLQSSAYLEAEVFLSNMAKNLGISPAEFGLMLWCKRAFYEPNRALVDFCGGI